MTKPGLSLPTPVGAGPAAAAPDDRQRARRFVGLRQKLAAVFVVLALPPLAVAAAYLFWTLPGSLEDDARSQLSAGQAAAASAIERHLAGVEADTRILAGLPSVHAYATAAASEGIDGAAVEGGTTAPALTDAVAADFLLFAGVHADYLQVRYLDASGHERVRVERRDGHLARVPDADLQDKSGRYYVDATLDLAPGDVYVSPLDLNRELGAIQQPHVPVIRFATLIPAEGDAAHGFVIVNLDASTLVEALRDTDAGDDTTELMLVDDRGYYLVHPDPDRSWSGPGDLDTGWNLFDEIPDLRRLAAGDAQPAGAIGDAFLHTTEDRQLVAGAVGPDERGWLLVASAAESAIHAPARALRLQLLAVFAAMAFVGLAVIWFATGRLSRPARLLREGAVQIGRGDFQHRIALPGSDELGDVAHAFDQMAEQLEDSYRTLEGRVAERTRDLQDRDRKLRGLNQIGMGLVAAPGIDDIATRAAEYARNLTDADHALVTLEGRPTIDADHVPTDARRLTHPVSAGGTRFGEILVARSTGRPDFQPVDRELLETLANQVGVAIENANLHARERQTVTRLEELNQAKTDFVSTVSHQLRTPVAALRGYAEIIHAHRDDLDEAQRDRILAVIADESEHLTELVEDVLRVSRIDAGRLTPEQRPILLDPLLDEVLDEARLFDHDAHPIEVRRGSEAALVVADPLLLRQALLNLVENAMKYSPPGAPIDIAWARDPEPRDPGAPTIRITIEDGGPGIPPDQRDRIFERFVRLKGPDGEPMAAGTGLGLYIARNIIEAHRGAIEVVDGRRGARFLVRLPIATTGSER